jgi:hypothetical protein
MKEELLKEDNEVEILNIIKQKNLQQGDKIKWIFSFSGWKDKTPVKHTGTFIRWELILENGMTKPLIPKYIKSAVGIMVIVKDDKIAPNKLSFLTYYFNGKGISDEQKSFETLEK